MSQAELSEFRQWFADFDDAVWDAKIEGDAQAGKFDALVAEAMAERGSDITND